MIINELERLLSEATNTDHTMEKELILLSALRNAAPALIAVVKAAKKPVCEHDSGSVCSYLIEIQLALKALDEVKLGNETA